MTDQVLTLYGIKSCDTMRKARAWLDAAGLAYTFHDYKSAGIEVATLRAWAAEVGWELLLNTRGATFRKLPDIDKGDLDLDKAVTLMAAHPSLIKRPVLTRLGGPPLVGFDPQRYATLQA